MADKITSFKQLRARQNARTLAVAVYKVTEKFPASEKFGLVSQLRRSAVSVAANIAEGFSRATAKDKIHFYGMALGSLTESLSHVCIAQDLDFLDKTDIIYIEDQIRDLQKMIHGLIKNAPGRPA